MLSWSSAAWKSSWRPVEDMGGGAGLDRKAAAAAAASNSGSDPGSWWESMGESGSVNFHWVKLWEVEEEDDSESGFDWRWVGALDCVGGAGTDNEGGNGSVDEKGRVGG